MATIAKKLRTSSLFNLKVYHFLKKVQLLIKQMQSHSKRMDKRFNETFGRHIDWGNPTTLNEKIQWLKRYDHDDFYTTCVDKYAVRAFIEKEFGAEYLVPLLFQTTDVHDIVVDNIPTEPCILKANHDSGHYKIIRDRTKVDYERLREECRFWLSMNYYDVSNEWPYKNINPRRIIIEKLLTTKSGTIPNDYKLHYINGELQFIYVSFDREGVNDRCTYDENWNRLPFVWVPKYTYREGLNVSDVPKPKSFELMKQFGKKVASLFKYVRVDFYDVDGKLYFGEITLYHGSGNDKFYPDKFDLEYGRKLKLGNNK